MAVSLKIIEIENFKSYRGRITIGPIRTFTAIIGPNGSGKSNILDAVRFALGEKSSNLRIKRHSDLVYGASFGKPTTDSTCVTLIFSLDKNTEKSFARMIVNKGIQHRINNKIVDVEFYKNELNKLGLNIELGNFLIPQEHVENVAIQTPKERTVLFEKLSGSIAFKADYDKSKSELLNVTNGIQATREKKRQLLKQIKYTKEEKEEAEEYLRLQEEYMKEKSELQTIRLLLIKKAEETSQDEQREIKSQIEKCLRDKENALRLSRQKELQLKSLFNSLESAEQNILKLENVIQKKNMECKVFKEKISYWEKKRDCAHESLNNASKAHESHKKILRELKEELQVINNKLAALEEASQESSVSLSNSQINRYMDLRSRTDGLASDFTATISNLKRDQQTCQDKLDNNNRRKQELEDKLKRITFKKEDIEKCFQKLHCLNKEYASKLIESTEKKQKLSDEITDEESRLLVLETECAKLEKEICERKIDNHILSQRNKNAEILHMLKEHFSPGVYGRLCKLCKPIHERYDIAVTKVFGKYMDAIVVDTVSTAQKCIHFLKRNKMGVEIFLPLDDSLKIEPLKETLRAIREPPNVKLLYDVLNISSSEINRAVLFVTRNTLVCETADDARQMAYESHKQNFDCVSLDGCYYRKTGLFSGGQVNLVAKAKKWTEQDITVLKERKEELMREHRKLSKLPLKKSEINEIDAQIKGFTFRKKYNEIELKNLKEEISATGKELSTINKELSLLNATNSEIERSIQEKDEQIGELQKRVRLIENEVFADFCRDIDVPDIDYYEKNNLRYYKEQNNAQMELEKQKDCIENQLRFENERDTKSKILRWKHAAEKANAELDKLHSEENTARIAIEEQETNLLELKNNYTAIQKNIRDVEKELAQYKSQIEIITKSDLSSLQKIYIDIQRKRNQRKIECNSILTECKIEDIIIRQLPELFQESFSTSSSLNWDTLMQIDFSQLPEEMLNSSEQDLRNTVNKLNEKLAEIQEQFETIENPNLKAHDKMDSLVQKLKELTAELPRMRKKYVKINSEFEIVKKKRCMQFLNCLEKVCAEIDSIYKILVNNRSAQAFVLPDNPEEPYLDGIMCSYKAPFKHFQPLQNFSGGEKVLASLALLFAFQRYKPTSFVFMDESDAALDKTNVKSIVSFIRSHENDMKFIVITLKNRLYRSVDALVGITTGHTTEPESKVFAILLNDYKK
ncbi:structural maintenance of chromosomes protein 1A-like [Pseudomyrmex gracilis]|uniref:structural maintenance of chromosomes protein 1A-like n=1 Tax=Pseudomyrmex gracilis TaxID=219809 RepID=UPI0009956EF0|nr:structural maintenance of chromosomes protein 1A-like [Pseudomyrmex gracilis]